MEQQSLEKQQESLEQNIEQIAQQTDNITLDHPKIENKKNSLSIIGSQKEYKDENKDDEEDGEDEEEEDGEETQEVKMTEEEKKKKIEKFQQCILAIVALKKMNTDNQPAKIMENLYLGSIGAALKKDVIEQLNIKYILSAMDKSKPVFKDICTYKQVPILDSPDQDIQKYFEESSQFIDQAIQSKQNILVHCFAGKSRSTTLVLAQAFAFLNIFNAIYLMKHHNLNLTQALELVKQTREIAQPNSGFINQLKLYEQKLKELKDKVELSENKEEQKENKE